MVTQIKRRFVYAAWIAGGILALPFMLFKWGGTPRRILVCMHAKIGDFVDQLPVCRALKGQFPSARITLLVTNPSLAGLAAGDPAIDKIMVWPGRAPLAVRAKAFLRMARANYDWAINISCQTWLDFLVLYCLIPHRSTAAIASKDNLQRIFLRLAHTAMFTLKDGGFCVQEYQRALLPLGITPQPLVRSLPVNAKNEEFVKKYSFVHGFHEDSVLIGILVSAGAKNKQWPEPHIIRLCSLLLSHYPEARILLMGWHGDSVNADRIRMELKEKERVYNTCGEFFLGEVASLCRRLSLCIGTDTGVMHIADAMGTPLVVISGPARIEERFDLTQARIQAVQPETACAPCTTLAGPRLTCSIAEPQSCLIHTTPEQVFEKAAALLRRKEG